MEDDGAARNRPAERLIGVLVTGLDHHICAGGRFGRGDDAPRLW